MLPVWFGGAMSGQQAYPGDERGDGHVCSQKDGQQGNVAGDRRPSGQRHEVVPVVDIGQGCMGYLGLMPCAQRLQQCFPQVVELLQVRPLMLSSSRSQVSQCDAFKSSWPMDASINNSESSVHVLIVRAETGVQMNNMLSRLCSDASESL